MGSLKEIRIVDVDYVDLNVIGSMKNLERLTVEDTKVKNLNFLTGLTKLKYLNIRDNYDLLSLPDLSSLSVLEELVIDCNRMENDNISFMNNLPAVKKLTFLGPCDLIPLYNMPNLEELYLTFGFRIRDLSPLSSAKNLKKLTITKSRNYYNTNDLSPIASLVNLEYLNMSDTDIYFKAKPIYSLPNLKYLNFNSCSVFGDFSQISNLTTLEELRIDNIYIADSFNIVSDGFMTSIYTDGEHTLDEYTGTIGKLTNLKTLSVSKNDLKNIDFTANLVSLEKFIAQDNYFTDINSLAELKNLNYVDLTANAIDNWNVLDDKINATIIGR